MRRYLSTRLTPKQYEILSLTAQGLSAKEIAGQLFISVRTVEESLRCSREKLGATKSIEAAHKAGIFAKD